MNFTITRPTTAPIEKVFDVMTDHRRLSSYVWFFRSSTLDREGVPTPNGVGAIRRLTSLGATFVEEIVEYDRPNLWAYTVRSGVPVENHLGTIRLRETETGTDIDWNVRATVPIPGAELLGLPVFKAFIDVLFKGAIRTAESDLTP